MGQKTNPTILRLGNNYDWSTKYNEKKNNEIALYRFKSIELENFTKNFFKQIGVEITKSKLIFSKHYLEVFLECFLSINSSVIATKESKSIIKLKIRNKIKQKEIIKKNTIKNQTQNFFKLLKINSQIYNKKNFQRADGVRQAIFYKEQKQYENNNNKTKNIFIEKYFESLRKFLGKNIKIKLNIKHLNNNIYENFTKENKKTLATKIIKLRKFQKNIFFKEGINKISSGLLKSKKATILAGFISNQLNKTKRPNILFRFIQSSLLLFIKKTNIGGIKIKIKGRIGKAPRAKNKVIIAGKNISNVSIHTKINYAETTSFTKNGTLGVKVWVLSKTKLQNVKRTEKN